GSTAFNIAILGVADLFFTRGSLFGSLDLAHLTAALFCILLTGLGLAQLLLLRTVKWHSVLGPSVIVMAVLYLVGVLLVFLIS
ncbi:MAG: hypothetical protein QGH72_05625, partial [Dehalococcoidia bacterium]|nr:hypothetical protein [Dehalococcoidia bacterium]